MAATIVVTSGVNILPSNEENIPQLCDHIFSSLSDTSTSTIATQCVRSLIMSSPKTACDQEIIRHFLPKLALYVTTPSSTENAAAKSAVCAILIGFVRLLFGEQIQVAMSLFVPMLLERARVEKGMGRETASRLLELAQVDQGAFRNIVASLQPAQRSFMEEVLRSDVAGREVRSESSQPTIALKMNFG